MTGQELQISFGTELRQHDDKLHVHSDDIFYWLNKAQNYLVTSLFTGRNPSGKSFEETQENIDALRTILKKTVVLMPPSTSDPVDDNIAETTFDNPDDYLWLIWVVAINGNDEYIRCKYVHNDKLFAVIDDPFNKPTATKYLYNNRGNQIVLYYPNTSLVNFIQVSYIREPDSVTRTEGCELPEFLHYRIVELAVKLFLEKQSQHNNS